jgi:hypothetical protein
MKLLFLNKKRLPLRRFSVPGELGSSNEEKTRLPGRAESLPHIQRVPDSGRLCETTLPYQSQAQFPHVQAWFLHLFAPVCTILHPFAPFPGLFGTHPGFRTSDFFRNSGIRISDFPPHPPHTTHGALHMPPIFGIVRWCPAGFTIRQRHENSTRPLLPSLTREHRAFRHATNLFAYARLWKP